jgi:hypothetical protein
MFMNFQYTSYWKIIYPVAFYHLPQYLITISQNHVQKQALSVKVV